MTKRIITLGAAALLSATLVGCGGNAPQPAAKPAAPSFACKKEGVLAPEWTCNPFVEGAYAGLGIASKSAAGPAHMRRVALGNGRSDLAQQIQTQVKDRLKMFTQTTGTGDRETVDQVTQAVTDQMAKVSLSGSKQAGYWEAPSGAIYLLVTVPEDYINGKVKNTVKTSLKNDDALWQQFQASKAFESMDAALEN